MSTSIFAWRAETKQMLVIALPIVAAQVLQVSMGAVDTVMAGRIDALSLAAIALGSSVWHFAMLCGVGLLLALPPIISQHLGAGNYSLVREELRQGLWLALITGLVLIALILGLSAMLPYTSIEAQIVPEAQKYLHWVCWSLPFTCLYLVPRALNDARGFTMPMLWIQIIILPINIFGNYVFMYGNFGAPEMGAAGAALSTGMAQVIGFILLLGYTITAKRYAEYDLAKRMTWPDWQHIKVLFRLGFPISISLGMEVGMFTTVALMMGKYGIDATAGHQVALSIASMTFMVPLGISMATTVRVGHAIGAEQYITAKYRGFLGIILCGSVMATSGICLWLFGSSIASLYTTDLKVITLASHFLMFAAVFQFVDGLQIGAAGTLRGYKDTTVPMVLNGLCYWGVGVGTAVYLTSIVDIGPEGLWSGLVVGLAAAAVLLNGRFYLLSR